MTFEKWLKTVKFPPPSLGDHSHGFYVAWGYEQWLIKVAGKDITQLSILLHREYTMHLARDVIAREGFPVGQPLIRSKVPLHGFPFSAVPVGAIGVELVKLEGESIVMYPATLEPYVNTVSEGDLERLGVDCISIEQTDALRGDIHPVSPNALEGWVCKIEGVNDGEPVFVGGVSSHGMGASWQSTIVAWDARQWQKKAGGYRRPAKAYREARVYGGGNDAHRYSFGKNESVRRLQHAVMLEYIA